MSDIHVQYNTKCLGDLFTDPTGCIAKPVFEPSILWLTSQSSTHYVPPTPANSEDTEEACQKYRQEFLYMNLLLDILGIWLPGHLTTHVQLSVSFHYCNSQTNLAFEICRTHISKHEHKLSIASYIIEVTLG